MGKNRSLNLGKSDQVVVRESLNVITAPSKKRDAERRKHTTEKRSLILAEHLADAVEELEPSSPEILFSVIDGMPVAATVDPLTRSVSIIVQNQVFHAEHHGGGRYTLQEDLLTRDYLGRKLLGRLTNNTQDSMKSTPLPEPQPVEPMTIYGANDPIGAGPIFQDPYSPPTAESERGSTPSNETPEQARLRGCKQSRDAGLSRCKAAIHPTIKAACVALVTVVYAMCTSGD